MSDYTKQLEVAVDELQTKLASSVMLTWAQDPKKKNTILLMTGPTSWIAKLSYSPQRGVSCRWHGKLSAGFQYHSIYAATKEDAIRQVEEKLRA